MCFSDSSSLGAPVLGAEACLDTFEEAFFCIFWKTKGPQPHTRSCLEQSLQGEVPWAAGEVSIGQCHCCALGADGTAVGGTGALFTALFEQRCSSLGGIKA